MRWPCLGLAALVEAADGALYAEGAAEKLLRCEPEVGYPATERGTRVLCDDRVDEVERAREWLRVRSW